MTDERPDSARNLARLYWQLYANEAARARGLVAAPMFEFARDTLQQEIAALEALYCTNKGGGNRGNEACAAAARRREVPL